MVIWEPIALAVSVCDINVSLIRIIIITDSTDRFGLDLLGVSIIV